MRLKLGIVFHFNQHLSEHALLASQVCYRGLLTVLLRHPGMKFNIHVSGTLIHALQWLDPKPLEMIRTGLERGQFELLGSTYSQNIPYATHDWDNARQIELHQKTLRESFGITPGTFWNPERCWRQTLIPLLADAGYHTTLIERHILESSGAKGAHVFETRYRDRRIKIVVDEERLIDTFNFAAWFGNTRLAFSYLERSAQTEETCLAYAEDAEAMGLWGYGRGVDPNQTWAHLDQFLSELEGSGAIETIHLQDAPDPVREISPVFDGSASWMDASLADKTLPYHEDGYRDWFDFLERSPKIKRFEEFFSTIRSQLQSFHTGHHAGAQALYDLALHTYLSHQYEFGCIGIGRETYPGWKGAQAALVLLQAARWAKSGEILNRSLDINADGWEEICQTDGRYLVVSTPFGGRVLYWIDLRLGKVRLGSPLAVIHGEHLGDSFFPQEHTRPVTWLPAITLTAPEELSIEAPPTRLGTFLDPWVWEEETGPLQLAIRNMVLNGDQPYLPAQWRGFVDRIERDGITLLSSGAEMSLDMRDGDPQYSVRIDHQITLEKTIHLVENGIEAHYHFTNDSPSEFPFLFTCECEIHLDLAAVLKTGQPALQQSNIEQQIALINPATGERCLLTCSLDPERVYLREGLLARIVGVQFELLIQPGNTVQLTLGLKLWDSRD